jgi:hypothetical protein
MSSTMQLTAAAPQHASGDGAGGASVRLYAAGAVPCVHSCPVWGVTVIQRLDHRQQAAGPAYSKN